MTLHNAPGQRNGQTEPAALLIESDTAIIVRIRKNSSFGDRDDGRPFLTRINLTVHDDSRWRRQFAKYCPEDSR